MAEIHANDEPILMRKERFVDLHLQPVSEDVLIMLDEEPIPVDQQGAGVELVGLGILPVPPGPIVVALIADLDRVGRLPVCFQLGPVGRRTHVGIDDIEILAEDARIDSPPIPCRDDIGNGRGPGEAPRNQRRAPIGDAAVMADVERQFKIQA